jgi:U-box domain/Ankyrin repeat
MHNSTPLIGSARVGQWRSVRFLLSIGALDYRDDRGETALHVSARGGHAAVVALLLERGSDHFALNELSQRCMDIAMIAQHTHIVRLLEARTCPFFGYVSILHRGMFGDKWNDEWIAVARPRPWDNPSISRDEVFLFIYSSKSDHTPSSVLLLSAEIKPLSADANDQVTFELTSRFHVSGSRLLSHKGIVNTLTSVMERPSYGKPKVFTCRAGRPTFTWLSNVLSESFSSGRGPAFDVNGSVLMPAFAQSLLRSYATEVFTGEQPVTTPAVQIQQMQQYSQHQLQQQQQQQQQPQSFQQPQYSRSSIPHAVPVATAASVGIPSAAAVAVASTNSRRSGSQPSASPQPGTSRRGSSQLPDYPSLDDIEFDTEPPSDYMCPITMELMSNPVVLVGDGHTYSKDGILQWIAQGKNRSPKTNEELDSDRLVPNHLLRSQILDWVEKHRMKKQVAAAATSSPAASVNSPVVSPPAPATSPLAAAAALGRQSQSQMLRQPEPQATAAPLAYAVPIALSNSSYDPQVMEDDVSTPPSRFPSLPNVPSHTPVMPRYNVPTYGM